jgi:hypothetical protein
VSDSIVVGPVDQATATGNRVAVESKSGVVVLPAGRVVFDRAPALKSGVTLVSNGTSLCQMYTGGNFPSNCTVATAGSGMGHVDFFEHRGRAQVWCAAAANCAPGTLVYCWASTNSTPSPVRERRTVVARNGNLLTLDQSIDARCNVLKWFSDASAISNVSEGASVVHLLRTNWSLAPGQVVLITSGPEIANEAKGELRTVTAVAGSVAYLDRPLRSSYTLAACAKVSVVENVTLQNVTVELPINGQSESLYMSLCRNWRLEGCTIRKTALGNCAGIEFVNCSLGYVQAAASSRDLRFVGCKIDSISFEEGCGDNTIDGCRIGPVGSNMNCVSMRAQSERLSIRNSHLLGGAWPSSQILFDTPGRECAFESLTMTGRVPCWLKGSHRLVNVHSDGEIHFQ